jgi:lipopolysaccharide/colanic/teichoic acid biosynthesis glycosyltransferase
MFRAPLVLQRTEVFTYRRRSFRKRARQIQRYLRSYAFVKRILDIVLCLAILPFALVVMLIIVAAILLDSSWPIFFCQERLGHRGRRFRLYKFRTLRPNYDAVAGRKFMQEFVRGQHGVGQPSGESAIYKPIDQAQMTRIGRILRKTSLDELPQIINVLRGDMSLVGPRPNVPWEVEAYRDWHMERLEALPGITGLAQVRGRSGISFDQIVRYDIAYIRDQGLMLDLLILWWTMTSVMCRKGAG